MLRNALTALAVLLLVAALAILLIPLLPVLVALGVGVFVTLLVVAIYLFGYLDGREDVKGLDGETWPSR